MERTTVKNNIGEVLRLLRISYDLSISELSKKQIFQNLILQKLKKGEKNPSNKILKNYSSGLGIPEETLNYLLNNYSQKHLSYQKLLIEILKKIAKL